MNPSFSERLIRWQRLHGRHNLPWQTNEPYRVWLSEIMLQQTQVATVLNYYPRFLAAFPDVHSLAAAEQDTVLGLWAGLGYYSRARNLHKAAKQVVDEFGGIFPRKRTELEKLCGVGRSTAAAIAAFAFHERETILDGNVKRVLCRVFALDGNPADKAFEKSLWTLAESLLPSENGQQQNADMPAYTQGLMDLGATVCKRSRPLCGECPMADVCAARAQNRIAELPRKKNAAAVQQISLFWLLLRDRNGRILLHKRPQKGIWGGLYCVPAFNALAQLQQSAAAFGIAPEQLAEHSALSHRLTHRLLEILPFSAQISSERPSENAVSDKTNTEQCELPQDKTAGDTPFSDGIWVAPNELPNYGLPKPLAALLSEAQQTLF